MMIRSECLKRLAAHRTDEIVVSVFQNAFEWEAIDPSHLNYYFVGAMGQAASHGLGLALAFPERRVVVLDGDGSLLMNLGSLVTIANIAPRNLTHIVSNNGVYETTGCQPTPSPERFSFAVIARGAGYPLVYEFGDIDEFDSALPSLLSAEGPVFIDLKAVCGPAKCPENFKIQQSPELRKAFKNAACGL